MSKTIQPRDILFAWAKRKAERAGEYTAEAIFSNTLDKWYEDYLNKGFVRDAAKELGQVPEDGGYDFEIFLDSARKSICQCLVYELCLSEMLPIVAFWVCDAIENTDRQADIKAHRLRKILSLEDLGWYYVRMNSQDRQSLKDEIEILHSRGVVKCCSAQADTMLALYSKTKKAA